MIPHEPTALDSLAAYFHTSEIALLVWICAIALVVIVAVGFACIELSTAPEPEGRPFVRRKLVRRDMYLGQAWLLATPIAIIALWFLVNRLWR